MKTIEHVKTIRNGKGGFMLLKKCDAPISEYCIPLMEGSMVDILKYLDDNGFKVMHLCARTRRDGEN